MGLLQFIQFAWMQVLISGVLIIFNMFTTAKKFDDETPDTLIPEMTTENCQKIDKDLFEGKKVEIPWLDETIEWGNKIRIGTPTGLRFCNKTNILSLGDEKTKIPVTFALNSSLSDVQKSNFLMFLQRMKIYLAIHNETTHSKALEEGISRLLVDQDLSVVPLLAQEACWVESAQESLAEIFNSNWFGFSVVQATKASALRCFNSKEICGCSQMKTAWPIVLDYVKKTNKLPVYADLRSLLEPAL